MKLDPYDIYDLITKLRVKVVEDDLTADEALTQLEKDIDALEEENF